MDEIGMFTALRPQPGPVDISGGRDRLAAEIKGVPDRRRAASRKTRLAMTGGLVAAATAAAIVVPATLPHGGGGVFTGTAWAVGNQPDGMVTITLKQEFSDPAGLERALRADGITAYVRSVPMVLSGHIVHPECTFNIKNDTVPTSVIVSEHFPAGNALGEWSWTIRPSAMPRGSALFLFTMMSKDVSEISEPVVLRGTQAPVCVPARQ